MKAEDIDKIIMNRIQEAMMRAAQIITDAAHQTYDMAVDVFYDEYNPKFYQRSYGYYKPAIDHIVLLNKGFEAGIDVISDEIGDYYHDPVSYVFDRGFQKAIHGTKSIYVGKRSPMWYMNKWKKMFSNKLPDILRKCFGG